MQRIFNPLMAPWSYNYNSMDGTEVVQAGLASLVASRRSLRHTTHRGHFQCCAE